VIKAKSKEEKELSCPDCKKSMCFNCGEDWHTVSCFEAKKKALASLGGDISSCPVCQVKVERTVGCNKMVCTYCGNSYCWECGKSIKGYAHFKAGGCGVGVYGAEEN